MGAVDLAVIHAEDFGGVSAEGNIENRLVITETLNGEREAEGGASCHFHGKVLWGGGGEEGAVESEREGAFVGGVGIVVHNEFEVEAVCVGEIFGVVLDFGNDTGEGGGGAARIFADWLELAEEAVFLVGLDELIAHGPDLGEGELGGGVRVHHGGVVDVLALASEECLDGEFLDVDVGADEGG